MDAKESEGHEQEKLGMASPFFLNILHKFTVKDDILKSIYNFMTAMAEDAAMSVSGDVGDYRNEGRQSICTSQTA